MLPALAAALVGRFSSFAITVGAALVIGILQSEISLFQPDIAGALDVSPASLTGLPQAVPLAHHPRRDRAVRVARALAAARRVARLPLPGSGRVTVAP